MNYNKCGYSAIELVDGVYTRTDGLVTIDKGDLFF